RASLVPHAAVVAGDHAEPVIAGRKIRVERLPAIADVLPVAIEAFELVAKLILLRGDEAERRVVDLQVAHERWQVRLLSCCGGYVVALAVGRDLLDVYRRRQLVQRQVLWIDDADAAWRDEPQTSVGRLGDRYAAVRTGKRPESLGGIEQRKTDCAVALI